MLQVVHQDVKVARILRHAAHLTNELALHFGHVLDLVEEMFLLLRFQHFLLRYDLHCVNGAMVLLWCKGRLSLVGHDLIDEVRRGLGLGRLALLRF